VGYTETTKKIDMQLIATLTIILPALYIVGKLIKGIIKTIKK